MSIGRDAKGTARTCSLRKRERNPKKKICEASGCSCLTSKTCPVPAPLIFAWNRNFDVFMSDTHYSRSRFPFSHAFSLVHRHTLRETVDNFPNTRTVSRSHCVSVDKSVRKEKGNRTALGMSWIAIKISAPAHVNQSSVAKVGKRSEATDNWLVLMVSGLGKS